MSECPEIVTYYRVKAIPGDRPPAPYIARLYRAGEFLPMIFSGDTPAAATAAAHEFWKTETAKIEASGIKLTKMRNARGRKPKVAA